MKLDEKKDSSVGGFQRVSDGWHNFEITDGTGYLEDKETKEATDTFMVMCQVVGEDEDEGAQSTMFCPLDKKFGRTRLAKILGYTGIVEQIEKGKKGMKTDLTPVEWGETYLNIGDPRSVKLVSEIQVKLPGSRMKGEVKTNKSKDSDGNEREFVNIINLAKADSKAPVKKAEPVEDNSDSDESW